MHQVRRETGLEPTLNYLLSRKTGTTSGVTYQNNAAHLNGIKGTSALITASISHSYRPTDQDAVMGAGLIKATNHSRRIQDKGTQGVTGTIFLVSQMTLGSLQRT